MKKFSVCTSFFNDEIVNVDSLYSAILNQNVDWEWVVTDDFSKNPKVKDYLILLSQKDSRVRFVNQTHKMQFMRNPSEFAEGEFIFHIDSDDLVYPGYLELCEKMFSRFPEVGVILTGAKFVSQHGIFRSYNIHKHREGMISFLGRCWRRSFEIDFTGIIEDNFFTVSNDMFIVNYLCLKTRLLIIPRIFIQYREFLNEKESYKPFGHRLDLSNELMESHGRTIGKFLEYYNINKQDNDGLFPYFESIKKLTTTLWLIHNAPNDYKINFVGFSLEPWQKILLQDLYFDRQITYNDDLQDNVINVIDTKKEIQIENKHMFLLHFDSTNPEEKNSFYSSTLSNYIRTWSENNTWFNRF
jgi:hypothetical protein